MLGSLKFSFVDNRCLSCGTLVGLGRGKSGLNRASQRVTPFRYEEFLLNLFFLKTLRLEEQWNRKNVHRIDQVFGNGRGLRADGVKTAKLCDEQDQIGERM